MGSELTNQPDGPTTADVRDGAGVTVAQLHRWTQAGYLDGPRQRGRKGAGRGTVAVWPSETVEKARIIAGVARTGKGADVEIGRALMRAGYGVHVAVARKVLLWYVERWALALDPPTRGRPARRTRQQRAARMSDAYRKDAPQSPGTYIERLSTAVVGVLCPLPDSPKLYTKAAYYLSPVALRQAVNSVDDTGIVAAWNDNGDIATWLATYPPSLITTTVFSYLKLPAADMIAAARAQLQLIDADVPTALRLLTIVADVAVRYYGDELIDAFAGALRLTLFPDSNAGDSDAIGPALIDMVRRALPTPATLSPSLALPHDAIPTQDTGDGRGVPT
jgi:hypothetical protein